MWFPRCCVLRAPAAASCSRISPASTGVLSDILRGFLDPSGLVFDGRGYTRYLWFQANSWGPERVRRRTRLPGFSYYHWN